jgi:hypothetical protein
MAFFLGEDWKFFGRIESPSRLLFLADIDDLSFSVVVD